jgi:hypothetical protein
VGDLRAIFAKQSFNGEILAPNMGAVRVAAVRKKSAANVIECHCLATGTDVACRRGV